MIDGGMRVLVAEDNDLVRGALCGMLRVMSAAVVEARSGKELINRVFGSERFDLVVCDVCLPERSGVAVARTARAAGIATPFLFVSGQAPTNDEIASVGDAAFLHKPFALQDLQEAVEGLIGR
jgi:two-component system, OmpR family, response regulator